MATESEKQQDRTPPRALVAPLDWGLGHATRCIPLIKVLQNKGFEVLLAAEGPIADLLRAEFPKSMILPLPGYKMRYGGMRTFFLAALLWQLPPAVITFFKARRRMKKWVKEFDISVVISDNRPELFDCGTRDVYISHQLEVKTGNRYLNRIATGIHRYFINRFQQCWVPDEEGKENLAGALSHPAKMPSIPVTYIGCLSRFGKKTDCKESYDLLVILSGPEPHRSQLEKKIMQQLDSTRLRVALVRGLPGEKEKQPCSNHIHIYNHLPSSELNEIIESSGLVLSRCGYSTVMDLATLGKKAILIPTPGQGEQEYLAAYLQEKKYFYTVSQDNMNIKKDMEAATENEYRIPEQKGIRKELILAGI